MGSFRSAIILTGLLGGMIVSTTAFAEDKDDATDDAENVVEDRAAEEQAGDTKESDDVGEASYNVENCTSDDDDADGEGDSNEKEEDDDSAEEAGSEEEELDDCEKVEK